MAREDGDDVLGAADEEIGDAGPYTGVADDDLLDDADEPLEEWVTDDLGGAAGRGEDDDPLDEGTTGTRQDVDWGDEDEEHSGTG